MSSLPCGSHTPPSHDHCSQSCLGALFHQLLPVGGFNIQHGTSLCWLLNHFVIGIFKEPLEWLLPCHVVPPAGTRVVGNPLEDQGLQPRGLSCLPIRGFMHTILLIRWHFTIPCLCPPFNFDLQTLSCLIISQPEFHTL